MALLRISGPSILKERDPAAFGRLDRAPEVKTLRPRLTRLAAHHCAEQLGAELARLRVDQRGHLMGFLYVDGHVRAYHGQRAILSKAYVARRHLAMPASTDYWINDRFGNPLFVITGEVDAALTRAWPRLGRGVHARLTAKQEQQLLRWINGKDPRQHGFDFGMWTRLVVRELIADKLGARFGCNSCRKITCKIGFHRAGLGNLHRRIGGVSA